MRSYEPNAEFRKSRTTPLQNSLSKASRDFFLQQLRGRCARISETEDVTGEYREWFHEQSRSDHAVLIRPDFYVFGHSELKDVDSLIDDPRIKMGVAAFA